MKNIKTYNTKLTFNSQSDFNSILQLLSLHQSIYNHMSSFIFKDLNNNINKKIINDNNYYQCRSLFPSSPSQIIIRAKDAIYSSYKSIKSNKKLHLLKQPISMSNPSIRLDKRLYKLLSNNQIKLTDPNNLNKRITCSFNPYPKLQELLSKYTLCDPLLFVKDKEIWLSLSFETPSPTHIENTSLGIDLGIKRFITTSEGNCYQDKTFLKQKRILRYNKRKLQSKSKYSHSAKSKLTKLKLKERNKNKQ